MRRERIDALIAAGDLGQAIIESQKYEVLLAVEELQLIRRHCENVLESRPWDALTIARKYHWTDLALKAARKLVESILASPGHDITPALDIIDKELAVDEALCNQVVREAYRRFIQLNRFDELTELVRNYIIEFTYDQIRLANTLTHIASQRRRRLAQDSQW